MQAIFVDEYQSLINLSVEVVVNLVKLGYPIDTIISLLTAEPLDQWPALELRLVRELVGVSKARAKLLVGH